MNNESKVCFGVFGVNILNLPGDTSVFLHVRTKNITIHEKKKKKTCLGKIQLKGIHMLS